MFGELSMNPSNYIKSSAKARQYIPLALGHSCRQARHEVSNLALCPAKTVSETILGPAPGRWTQYDTAIIDPANICFYLPILTRTAFVDEWNDSRLERQADTQNATCKGVADGGRMVAIPALFITEWLTPETSRFLLKKNLPKLSSRYIYSIKCPKTEEKQNFGGR